MSQPMADTEQSAVRRTIRFVTGRGRRRGVDTSAGPPVICVSHREPYAPGRSGVLERTTGGLVSAMDGVLRHLGGRWIASGTSNQQLSAPDDGSGRSYSIQQIGLTTRQMDNYYSGFANRVLWPLFHYFIGRVNFRPEEWNDYTRVNRLFASSVLAELAERDNPATVTWVHDYHLLLVPRLIREASPRARVGFFLHIPFPAYEVFRILPSRREILEGMLGADLIGFHTHNYLDAFLDSARRLLGARVDKNGSIEYQGHVTRTITAPIGIDVEQQAAFASDPRSVGRAQRLRKSITGESLVLGVDRLDYSKGLPERLVGFERLLERHPEHRGHVTFVQIAVPSRTRVEEYRELKRMTDETVGRINGRFGDAIWTPVRYLSRSFQPSELASYYRAADVALVTPLRDGMNLVAKEYVASRTDLGGALVLSEFAGAADELPQAYFVNPFGPDSIAEALHQALTDDRVERERRMSALLARVRANDVRDWARNFINATAKA